MKALQSVSETTGAKLATQPARDRVGAYSPVESAPSCPSGAVHTNTIDGFWSHLKRGIMGSYHKVSKDCPPLYVNEFSWR